MKYTIFGESHGPAVGVVLTGVPAGFPLDLQKVQQELDRRAPGRQPFGSPRKEADEVSIISGMFEGRTTGAPLTMAIHNLDQHSADYESLRYTPRPSHGDYAGFIASKGCQDYRGGGHFSGRLTAPLVAAGGVARQLLEEQGIQIGAHISKIYGICDTTPSDPAELLALHEKDFPVLDEAKGHEMRQVIQEAKADGDSVGGAISCAVLHFPAGYGSPDFGRNVEGIFSQHLFAVPGVKGINFGAGVDFANLRGSEANDPFAIRNEKVVTTTNHSGGINGGITNGMPILFEVTLRPTASIAMPQNTVDLRTSQEVKIKIKGRHDPCIVPRAVPAIEAAAALAAWELLGK